MLFYNKSNGRFTPNPNKAYKGSSNYSFEGIIATFTIVAILAGILGIAYGVYCGITYLLS